MRSKASETITAANEPAFARNAQPVPTLAITSPATAGPTMRAALNDVEFNATAFDSSASETRSETNVCRAGASNAVTHPSRSANTYTCQSCARDRSP